MHMNLGKLSNSLSVKDIHASMGFYEKLGFEQCGGDPDQNWAILQNGTHTIGLFQGMFENNMLTFNPGWDAKGNPTETFLDVRDIRRVLVDRGIETTAEEHLGDVGPGSFMVIDPDGNPILFDQHV
jgi:hypothetical protein